MRAKVLILGARGMLGHKLICQLYDNPIYNTFATMNSSGKDRKILPFDLGENLICNVNAENTKELDKLFKEIQPDIVINCIAKTKTADILLNTLSALNINSRLPHLLAERCQNTGARFIHISTDSLFGDIGGNFPEDAKITTSDIYSMTKFLGEVNSPGSLTIRTSIIGHELKGKLGLVEWFLSQGIRVKGYSNFIYTGLPTIELANIIINFILPNKKLSGIYHIGSEPISKYEILKLISFNYKKDIEIELNDDVIINRSLNTAKFHADTGYVTPSWQELISIMHQDYIKYKTWY